jgi:DNA-binding MarR family transcriptional regulator
LGEENVMRFLRDFGVTQTEAEVYLFLARHSVLKGTQIARQVKKDKAQIYHILKSLQTKGLVESSVEVPARFVAVPFETVVELTIKSKRAEVAQIECNKRELLEYWQSTKQGKLEPALERFLVVEGGSKIFPRILELINQTRHGFCAVSTVRDLQRAEQFGLLDAVGKHPLKSQIHFRLLTELSQRNMGLVKGLMERNQLFDVDFRRRNPNFGLPLLPELVIRDGEELMLVITQSVEAQPEVCLWTNCAIIVHFFSAVFEDFWCNAEENVKILGS